jgi:hypothetical protein
MPEQVSMSTNIIPNHSTETAIICVMNDMITVLVQGHVGALMLLDMSAAFNTVDHFVLVEFLRRRFGVRDAALSLLEDFYDKP